MTVRPVESSDHAEWLALRAALWPHCSAERHASEMREYGSQGRTFAAFVATQSDGLIGGFVEASIRSNAEGCSSKPIGYIEGIFVQPDGRRRRIGQALVAAAAQWAASRGCTEMGSDCHSENEASIAFHQALGLGIAKRLVHFCGPLSTLALAPLQMPASPNEQLASDREGSNGPSRDDREFLDRFERQSIPLDEWNHRAHLKVAYLYLARFSLDEALLRLRAGIRAHNAAHKIVDSQTSGYHETMTQAWLRLIHVTLRQFGPAASADAFLDAQPQLGQKRMVLLFYSRDLMMSAQAKASFVSPDLAPLPQPLARE